MLCDPTFRETACHAQDVVSVEVDLTTREDEMSVVIDQLQKTDDLPGFARTFAGDSTRAVQREEWSSRTEATLRIETPGKPTDMRGTIRLMPSGAGGTIEVVELEVKVKVPLIGGKLEKLMASRVAAGMDIEHATGVSYLSSRAGGSR